MTTTLMNWMSLTKSVRACGLLLSRIPKSSLARSGMSLPVESVTVAKSGSASIALMPME